MSITKITATHNGKKALEYILKDRGHNGNERRNEFLTGYNMVSPDAVSYYDQMEKYWSRKSEKTKIEVRRVTQSFSRNELNPDDDNDVFKAHEIGIETGRRLFPDRQFIVATQTDGKSGLVHNHIFVNNINMVTNRGMDKTEYDYRKVRIVSDEVVKNAGINFDHGQKSEKYSQTERAKREKDEYVWKDDLRDRIREALSYAKNVDELSDAFDALGVDCHVRGKTVTYTLMDTSNYVSEYGTEPKKPLKSRAKKLGEEFTWEEIEKTFLKNQGQFTDDNSPNFYPANATTFAKMKGDDEEEEEETPDAPIEEIKEPEEVPSDVPEEETEKVADDSEDTDEIDAFTALINEQEQLEAEVIEEADIEIDTEVDLSKEDTDEDKILRDEYEKKRQERLDMLRRSSDGRASVEEIYSQAIKQRYEDESQKE